MNQDLLPYYERELIFVRKVAAEFAEQYPERAEALRLGPSGSEDLHVERILQAFALIAGRIQYKLDDEFPEITNALLELMYPHLLRPVPPMCVVQFEVDPVLSKQRSGYLLPRGTAAYSAPMDGVQCRFSTAYPVRLWPLEVASARFGNSSDVAAGMNAEGARFGLRIELKLTGGNKLMALDLSELRFRIGGDQQAAHWIYELLFTRVKRIVLRALDKNGKPLRDTGLAALAPEKLRQVGFGRDEALLPVAETSFQGYRLMQEYFSYPQKFLFFDIEGLEALPRDAGTERFEIVVLFDAIEQTDRVLLLESAVTLEMFQLGCSPAINLFQQGAEPIRLSHTKTEYAVVPDVYSPLGYEVYSVDRVIAEAAHLQQPKVYRPFYSLQHGQEETRGETSEAFWFVTRAQSTRGVGLEQDVFLSFVDRNFKLSQSAGESITLKLTCSNRDLASRLKTNIWGELDLEAGAMVRTRLVETPTKTVRPEMRGALQWRLISHLSLNHLSVTEGGADALREMLRLYNAGATRSSMRQIEGVISIRSARKVARMNSEHGFVFCPGVVIDAEMDEEKFSGGGAFLLANILERFFGLYCAVNSFTQLRVTTRQREGVAWRWPIRSGGTGRRLDEGLFREAYEFEFFQAVRLLLLAEDEGGRARKVNDVVRFRVHSSMSFPPSPVVKIERGEGSEPATMTVAFVGLIGPSRMLPDSYTELALRQRAFGDESFAAFFDVFHHRLLALYYRAWEKHKFAIGQEQAREGRDAVTGYLLSLIGMGTTGLEKRLPFADDALLRYAGLLAQRPRSAECLRALLSDWLQIPVAIKQFCGRWHLLDEEDLTALGSEQPNSQLGEGAAAGDMVWNLQSLIRIVLGPLNAEEFFSFLPDTSRFEEVTQLIRWYLGPAIDFELQPVLAAGVEPGWGALGRVSSQAGGRSLRLGWSGWLTDEAFEEPAMDAVFAESEADGGMRWR